MVYRKVEVIEPELKKKLDLNRVEMRKVIFFIHG
jgi:hypothetical protein